MRSELGEFTAAATFFWVTMVERRGAEFCGAAHHRAGKEKSRWSVCEYFLRSSPKVSVLSRVTWGLVVGEEKEEKRRERLVPWLAIFPVA